MKLITIATFDALPNAQIACSKLRAYGVEAFLFDDHLISANFLYAHAVGGVKLKVLDEEKEQALAILDEEDISCIDTQCDDAIQRCPLCHSQDVVSKRLSALEILGTFFVFGAPLRLQSSKRQCQKCGYEWRK